jgi:hypothetical protein
MQLKNNNLYSAKHSSLFSKWSNDLCSSSFQACFEHCWNQAANKLSLADKNNKLLDVITYRYLWACFKKTTEFNTLKVTKK